MDATARFVHTSYSHCNSVKGVLGDLKRYSGTRIPLFYYHYLYLGHLSHGIEIHYRLA